jgi:ADP-ribose pyrophosphatase
MRLKTKRAYNGRRINVDLDTVQFPDGSSGTLEMVRHPGAAAVVPLLDSPAAADPRAILIRQYRYAALDHLWEIPAGTLEPREPPEVGRLEHLTSVYTTPGFTDEVIHLYLARDLTRVAAAPERDEFLEIHEIRWSKIGAMIRHGQIRDTKTLTALMFIQCFFRPTGASGRGSTGLS